MGHRGISRTANSFRRALIGSASLLSLAAIAQGPALAQTPEAQVASGEIVVTARKREERLIETPAAISAFSADTLEDLNVANLEDVGKYVPNLNVQRYGVGNTAHAAIFIRGIGLLDHIITTDPGVGVYLDGVYLGRQMGANLGLNNIERVEVLRGPQGTLYGRNSLGGAVNIITTEPGQTEEFLLNVKAGTRGRVAADFYAATPLSDTFSVSASGAYKRRDGIGEFPNLEFEEKDVGEELEISGRVTAAWRPNEKLKVLASVDATQGDNGLTPYGVELADTASNSSGDFDGDGDVDITQADLAADSDDNNTNLEGIDSTSNESYGVSLTVAYEISDTLSTKVLASYRASEYTGGLDDDAVSASYSEFPEEGEADQVSLEWQLNAQIGKADLVGGLYYFNEDGRTFSGPYTYFPFNSAGAGDVFDINQEASSYAAYANLKYDLTPRVTVGGGLRYTKDEKDADALFPWFPVAPRQYRSIDSDAVTWDVNTTYEAAEALFFYGQIQRGYQSGGFTPRPFSGAVQFQAYEEQFATNYELGVKGEFFDSLSLNLAAFWTVYEDLALPYSIPGGGGFVTVVENAGESRARGVELDGVYRVGGFSLTGSIGYLDAEITDTEPDTQVQEGDKPALTPEWTISVAPRYEYELAGGAVVAGQIDYSYRGEMYGQSVNTEIELISERDLVGFALEYQAAENAWVLALYGENIFDEVYDTGRLAQTGFVGVTRNNDRSEFGLRFSKRFGG